MVDMKKKEMNSVNSSSRCFALRQEVLKKFFKNNKKGSQFTEGFFFVLFLKKAIGLEGNSCGGC